MNKEILEKANYKLNCKIKPCSFKGCPLNNDIPLFINQIKNEDYEEAFNTLTKTTVLPAICGRICPHFKQCMGACIRGIKGEAVSIGELEAFVGDMAIKNNYKIKKDELKDLKNKKIAIIGGGPAGLTCAAFLAKRGAKCTIYEKYNYLGGILIHGIPKFRLNKEIVEKSIEKILELGINVEYNKELGNNLNLYELEKMYDNIIISIGANVSTKMKIEGEDLKGVFGGNELLEYNNHPNYIGKIVIVNGGGNVAMDTARTVKKLGAKEVIVIYRRGKEQMPAEKKEVEDAEKEGVKFLFQNNLVKILGDEKKEVKRIELIKTKLINKEGDNRLSPENILGSNYEINADYVIMALGSKPDIFIKNLNLKVDKNNYIVVDENGKTSNSKIYAIGDVAGNIKTVAWAARSGREIAKKI